MGIRRIACYIQLLIEYNLEINQETILTLFTIPVTLNKNIFDDVDNTTFNEEMYHLCYTYDTLAYHSHLFNQTPSFILRNMCQDPK